MKSFCFLNHTARRSGAEILNSLFSERSAGASWRSLVASTALAALPLAIVTGPLHAQGPTVKVEGPVQVQGVVEVLNDVLRKPYVVGSVSNVAASFKIPDGKRLVIEMIALEMRVDGDFVPRMILDVNQTAIRVPLPVQFAGSLGTSKFYIGTIPFKARLDSVAGSPAEARVYPVNGVPGTINATVFGYLVDL